MSWIWLPPTLTAHQPWTTSPIMHCTHTFPSTITPITQLSPFTNQPRLPHHTCTSFSHSHKSSTHALTLCEVLFCPGYISERSSPYLLSLCVTPDCRPSISEPVPVTSTPAWYCLRLCFASDIPVFACWPLPVWFCPRLINIGAIGSARLRPLPYSLCLNKWTVSFYTFRQQVIPHWLVVRDMTNN